MTMPDVPPPEDLLDHQDVIRKLKRTEEWGWMLSRFLNRPWPIEFRPVLYKPGSTDHIYKKLLAYWFRAAGLVEASQWIYRTTMAFVSDIGILTALGLSHSIVDLQGVSIDHSWFHDDVDMNEWMDAVPYRESMVR